MIVIANGIARSRVVARRSIDTGIREWSAASDIAAVVDDTEDRDVKQVPAAEGWRRRVVDRRHRRAERFRRYAERQQLIERFEPVRLLTIFAVVGIAKPASDLQFWRDRIICLAI